MTRGQTDLGRESLFKKYGPSKKDNTNHRMGVHFLFSRTSTTKLTMSITIKTETRNLQLNTTTVNSENEEKVELSRFISYNETRFERVMTMPPIFSFTLYKGRKSS